MSLRLFTTCLHCLLASIGNLLVKSRSVDAKVDILCVFRTSFIRQPSIGGKEVDLFLLHNRVDVLGGYDKVCIVAHTTFQIYLHLLHLSTAYCY